MNYTYYNENKVDEFFDKVFLSQNTEPLLASDKFQSFLYNDLWKIIQHSNYPETISNWSKFLVRFKVSDNDIWTTLA